MEILSPEDRVLLWRSAIDARGPTRAALLHAIAREIVDGLSRLDLYSDEHVQLTLDSLQTLDDAGLFARDSLRKGLELLHEPDGGVELLVAEVAGLLREAAGIERLGAERRVLAVEMASQWREHVAGRRRPEPQYVSVGEVAARYGLTTQAVYQWLKKGRIQATRGPGGSWLIPAAQFDADTRPATARRKLDELQAHLVRVTATSVGLEIDEQCSTKMRTA
jgi:excisionase family DNA binding protein